MMSCFSKKRKIQKFYKFMGLCSIKYNMNTYGRPLVTIVNIP